jgi:hypothetical protein
LWCSQEKVQLVTSMTSERPHDKSSSRITTHSTEVRLSYKQVDDIRSKTTTRHHASELDAITNLSLQ